MSFVKDVLTVSIWFGFSAAALMVLGIAVSAWADKNFDENGKQK